MNIKELAEQAEDYANKESETVPKLGWFNLRDKKFAERVAAHEREECAKLCEPQSNWDDPLTAYEIAKAIRARSKA
jgi:hypothetical protein